MAAVFLACHTRQKILNQFERAGYVQQPTTRRSIDLFLNFAVIGACYYWIQDWAEAEDLNNFWLSGLVVLWYFMLWGGIFLALLGPTLWFSVRSM